MNTVTTVGVYSGKEVLLSNYTNVPSDLSIYTSFTFEVMSAGADGQISQRLTTCRHVRPTVYQRFYINGTWGDWFVINGVDFIVEQGTYGNWDYVKWESGRIELTGCLGFTEITLTSASAGTYYGTSKQVTVPFVTEIRSIHADETSLIQGHSSGIYVYECSNRNGNTFFTDFRAYASITNGVCDVDYYIVGRWK